MTFTAPLYDLVILVSYHPRYIYIYKWGLHARGENSSFKNNWSGGHPKFCPPSYSMSRCSCQKLSALCTNLLGLAGIPSIKSERQIFNLVFHRALNLSIFHICWKKHTKYSKNIVQKTVFASISTHFVCRNWYLTCIQKLYPTFDFLRHLIPENA